MKKQQHSQGVKFRIIFESIFDVEVMQKAFKEHLIEEFNEDPFDFILYIRELPEDKSQVDIKKYKEMVNDYIRQDSKNELNISGKIRLKTPFLNSGKHFWKNSKNMRNFWKK